MGVGGAMKWVPDMIRFRPDKSLSMSNGQCAKGPWKGHCD